MVLLNLVFSEMAIQILRLHNHDPVSAKYFIDCTWSLESQTANVHHGFWGRRTSQLLFACRIDTLYCLLANGSRASLRFFARVGRARVKCLGGLVEFNGTNKPVIDCRDVQHISSNKQMHKLEGKAYHNWWINSSTMRLQKFRRHVLKTHTYKLYFKSKRTQTRKWKKDF